MNISLYIYYIMIYIPEYLLVVTCLQERRSALMLAAQNGCLDMCAKLGELGANTDLSDWVSGIDLAAALFDCMNFD